MSLTGSPVADRTRVAVRTWTRTLTSLLVLGLLAACGSSGPGHSASAGASTPAAVSGFLHRYVDADGRVVRHDQGGDTVSEGQGYALLLAVAAGDETSFRRVWRWTSAHLQRPDGLFAYRWAGGHVADANPATDADLQLGWALALAGRRFHEASFTRAAGRVGRAIAAHEIGYDDAGRPVLAAGPWAVRPGRPTVVEPGYWTPPAQRALAELTGDRRLHDLTAAGAAQLGAMTKDGATLPPDWAQLGSGQPGTPLGGPDGTQPVQAGPDGLRALVWSALDPAARPLAAKWWSLISATADQAPLARGLDGQPASGDKSALSAVAAAAAARAAGDRARSDALLDRARQLDRSYPTYYGAAWVALGEVLLTTDRLKT